VLVRKTVTVLFCDVTESTRLGESLDPESHRRLMSRYFDEMRSAIEHHGGTVEKFIGDAVMAVFGVPTVHEDDALRAVRAASDMRERLRELNQELDQSFGITLEMRIGVNTGEVVAGDPEAGHNLVTGDAVVVAKRLEEAAPPGQILIGKATYPLVRDAVDAGPLETYPAKGKREDVPSRRLDEVHHGQAGIARRFDARVVGREGELRRLEFELDLVEGDRACRLLTLLGPAGIGKSRLAQELQVAAGERATTLSGRCLPYGEGITFWPLVNVVRSAGGEEAVRRALGEDEDGRLAADHLLAGIGAIEGSASTEETFWGIRRYLEALAREQTVVLRLEDLHWAEPTFLDLVDYLAGWVHDAPVLILCLARPELLERRPAWSAPRGNATILSLEPLSDAAVGQLLADIAGSELSAGAKARIAEAGEGNPLFLEQLAAMAVESDGTESIAVPPSIQAVISERLDRLPRDERTVIECAAVAGKQFLRGAVVDMCSIDQRAVVGPALRELVRKGLVRPDASMPGRDDGFRFGHVLIRDVTYEAMPKELRAELHERFPDWIQQNFGDRALELEEIAAYHLEQAHRYRSELGPADERTHELRRRAASLLGNAGGRALDRGDMPAAVTLLERALALEQLDGGERGLLLTRLGSALMKTGQFERAGVVLDDAVEQARAEGNRATELRATIERQFQRSFTSPEGAADEDRRVAEAAIPELEQLDAPRTLARAWWLLSESYVIGSRWGERAAALEKAIAAARRSPSGGADVSGFGALLAQALYYGPTPVPEAIARCEELRRSAYGPATEAALGTTVAALHAMEGRVDEARALYADSIGAYERLGLHFGRAARSHLGAQIELLGGDPPAAARELQLGYETLEAMGERGVRSTLAGFLADVLCTLGHDAQAERFASFTEEAAGAADLVPQVLWRRARARLEARSGDRDHALALAREAVERTARTDYLDLRGDTLVVLAEVLAARGNHREAVSTLAEARRIYESKGNSVSAQNAAQPLVAETSSHGTDQRQLGGRRADG
jgi:class 3 adenylate cyclase/tetratricopeptide (TPR) repeat protein